jgi:hypothetical protein
MPVTLQTVLLLTASNVFMTFAQGGLPLISHPRQPEGTGRFGRIPLSRAACSE